MNTTLAEHKNTELFYSVLKDFEEKLIKFEGEKKIAAVFSSVYNKWKSLIKSALEDKPTERDIKIGNIFQLFQKVWEYVVPQIGVKDRYYRDRNKIFDAEEILYIDNFKIKQKAAIDFLLKKPVGQTTQLKIAEQIKYVEYFIRIAVLFCKKYNLAIYLNNDGNFETKENDSTATKINEYYLFYNRSHIQKMDLGIGSVKISNGQAYVDYYYKSTDSARPFDVLETTGPAKYYPDASILVFSNVKDINNKNFYKSTEPVESCYILKKYKDQEENIILGIITSYNRDKKYPVSSAVVLVAKDFYNLKHPKNSPYGFEIERILKDKSYLPRIFYFLYNQCITLESVIDENIDRAKGLKVPFNDLDQIPFYKEDAEHLDKIAGRYQGLSILPNNNKFWIILSDLEIKPSGLIILCTEYKNGADRRTSTANKGFVKNIELDHNLNGKIYLNLKYNFEKHYNNLNHYLDFKMHDLQHSPTTLKGAFAGISLVTTEPVAATAIFQRVSNNTEPKIKRLEVTENDEASLKEVKKLINSHKSLFKFYQSESDQYTNLNGINFLRKSGLLNNQENEKNTKQYEVFISVPLCSSGLREEYERNCGLVKKLIGLLTKNFPIKEDKIYCSCINGNDSISYDDYKANHQTSTFEKVRDRIKSTRIMIFLFPKRMNKGQQVISSSFVEMGSAIAFEKKIIIFCDFLESNNLPKAMINLNLNTTFQFKTDEDRPFNKIVNDDNNKKLLKSIFKI